MAATTFPTVATVAATLAVADDRSLRQRSEVRAVEEHSHSGVCDLHGRISRDVLCAVRDRAGLGKPRKPQRKCDLHAGDHGMFRSDGGRAVRIRREPRHRARTGLAAGEARLAHASVRLFPGQTLFCRGIQHRHHVAAARRSDTPSAECACQLRRQPNWWEFWSQVRSRSAPWAWQSATSPSPTRRPGW